MRFRRGKKIEEKIEMVMTVTNNNYNNNNNNYNNNNNKNTKRVLIFIDPILTQMVGLQFVSSVDYHGSY